MKPIWFKRGAIRWKAPGKWRAKSGYIYVLFWADGDMKVGASCNPGRRVGESSYHPFERRSVIVPLGRRFRLVEKRFHETMRPLQLACGRHARSEVYDVTDKTLLGAVMNWIERRCSESALAAIDKAVNDFIDRQEAA